MDLAQVLHALINGVCPPLHAWMNGVCSNLHALANGVRPAVCVDEECVPSSAEWLCHSSAEQMIGACLAYPCPVPPMPSIRILAGAML
eukprot:259694-Chlamydomonas_euryale.AAC.1